MGERGAGAGPWPVAVRDGTPSTRPDGSPTWPYADRCSGWRTLRVTGGGGVRSCAYSRRRFPRQVLEDSARAVRTHPDVVLMPAAFLVVERTGDGNWEPGGGLHATAHDARLEDPPGTLRGEDDD
ncbi:DUF5954 family protein [Streptomyces sp. NPDC020807]|uniref:DUF5954 family protein n=1 Tax=Streptomyces sp. NPDC020807 TaxID=3155119 RepID=UPI0033F31CF6